jgi:hypothetical protein
MTMYKYTVETVMLAGASERPAFGVEYVSCFSRSPRKAQQWEGVRVSRLEGEETTPIAQRRTLRCGSRVIYDRWD